MLTARITGVGSNIIPLPQGVAPVPRLARLRQNRNQQHPQFHPFPRSWRDSWEQEWEWDSEVPDDLRPFDPRIRLQR